MILTHEKKAVQDALYSYLQVIASGKGSNADNANRQIIQNVYNRLRDEHDPVGGFCFGDYKSFANEENNHDLTDEQVNEWMSRSAHWFDASIGMSWDVMGIHLDMWLDDKKIEKTLDKAEED